MALSFDEIMDYYNLNSQVYNFIKRDADNLMPFIGAGLTAFTYKAWGDTLKSLYGNVPEEAQPKIKALLDKNKYEGAADAIYKEMGPLQFYKALRVAFDEKNIDEAELKKQAVALLPI